MIIDCISDLHGFYPKLDGGDLLIIAGDLTAKHTYQEYILFCNWLSEQDYGQKIFIAGNHDPLLQNGDVVDDLFGGIDAEYLCDSHTNAGGFKVWGTPWTPCFYGMNSKCAAFTGTDKELAEKFALIPSDTDILITHTPPYGLLDEVEEETKWGRRKLNTGSESLYQELYSGRIKPKLHVYGHIHEGFGHIPKMMDMPGVQFVNASYVNEYYEPVNKPIRVIL